MTRVLRAMRSRRKKVKGKTSRSDLARAIHYLANQHRHGRMNYPQALKRNYPIGTGITEAAAKTVVGVRMKRAGARFSQHGGQTVMLFRAAVLSERFDSLHRELHATYTAAVAA
ncbi:MAG: hypothetical protein KF850_40535 [Labilithrix sp.]|nr:hypothetical protein [Labilithrix sp.]